MRSTFLLARPELTPHPTELSAIWKPQRGPQIFDTYNEPTTCLSAEGHEEAVKDLVQHYFGCIEICQRVRFFDESNDVWVNERKLERKRLVKAMGNAPTAFSADDIDLKLDEIIKQRMTSVAVEIEVQYKRTEIMRGAIMKPPSLGGQPDLVSQRARKSSEVDELQDVHRWNFRGSRLEEGGPRWSQANR